MCKRTYWVCFWKQEREVMCHNALFGTGLSVKDKSEENYLCTQNKHVGVAAIVNLTTHNFKHVI